MKRQQPQHQSSGARKSGSLKDDAEHHQKSRTQSLQNAYKSASLSNPRQSKQLVKRAPKFLGSVPKSSEWIPTEESLEDYILYGRVKNLPKRNPKVVRIFLSSTFSDMYIERNALLKWEYPKLQAYCNEKYNLDFQVVDMRWGVRNTATNDHSGVKLCMTELDICQKESLGPNFVLLLGQRYGSRTIPSEISEDEFSLLVAALVSLKKPPADLEFLQKWYLCDINSVPPHRRLQPLDLMKIDQKEFSDAVEPRLQQILRDAADWCLKKKQIDEKRHHSYFWSVTEEEVYNGILSPPNPNDHCLCFTRVITNVNYKNDKVERFIDMKSGDVDKEAQELLAAMKKRVYGTLNKANIVELPQVKWCNKGGMNEDVHAGYLRFLCKTFYTKVTDMVDKAVAKEKMMYKISKTPLLSEIMEHSLQAKAKFDTFQGRPDITEKIMSYIKDDSSSYPFTVYGGSGFGKTSILAMASISVFDLVCSTGNWLVVRRFLGTTPDSTNIESLLYSLAQQVKTCLNIRLPFVDDPLSILEVTIKCIPKSVKLVLILDSLDQLSAVGKAHTLKWLPLELPSNVKIVVSTLPEDYDLLDTLKSRGYPDEFFAQVEVLGMDASLQILNGWLSAKGRCLTERQLNAISSLLQGTTQASPLLIKLMFDILKVVPSYWPDNEFIAILNRLNNPRDCIQYITEKLRQKHGRTLVDTAFTFLHLSNQGLTENEIVNLLSLDEIVLNDVFQFHMPPLRRLPAVLWTRIRHDVAEYVVEREANGAKVLAWYHRQFVESGQSNFVDRCQISRRMDLQLLMVDYFMGVWANGRKKPFTFSDAMVKKLQLSSNEGAANRFVPAQPNVLSNCKPNLRKLSQLPPLLLATDKIDIFLEKIIGSIEYLVSMFEAYTWTEISAVLDQVTRNNLPETASFFAYTSIFKSLLLCCSTAAMCPSALGVLLAGRLLPLYGSSELVDHLLEDIYSKGIERNALVVTHCQLEGLGTYLLFEMTNDHIGPCHSIKQVVYHRHKYIMSVSRRAAMIDLQSPDISTRYMPPQLQDGDHFGVLEAVRSSNPEFIAASLTQVPKVFVFSVKLQKFSGSFDCREVYGFEKFRISDMKAFRANEKELIAVWGTGLHGFLLYSLSECEMLYRYVTDWRILMVAYTKPSLHLFQSGHWTLLDVAYYNKNVTIEVRKKFRAPLPTSLHVTAQHIAASAAIATSDGTLFLFHRSSHGGRLILDSPAHSLTSREAEYIACTRDCVYSILAPRDRSTLAIQWKILKRLDWAACLRTSELFGYRIGTISVFEVSQSGGITTIKEKLNFVGHAKPITGLIISKDMPTMFMTSSADGSVRFFDRGRKINKYGAEMSQFDRMDLQINIVRGNGLYGLSIAKDNRIVAVWSLKTGKIVQRLYHEQGSDDLLDALVLGQFVVTADSKSIYIWSLDSTNLNNPMSIIGLPNYHNMVPKSPTEIIVITQSAVAELNVPTGNVKLTKKLPMGKRLVSQSWSPQGLALLVDPDDPVVLYVVDGTFKSNSLADLKCLKPFGTKVTGLHRCGNIIVLTFSNHLVFLNLKKNSVLMNKKMKRPILMKSLSHFVGVQSGLIIYFFEVSSGITSLGSIPLSTSKDIAALSADGRHCIVTKMPRMVQLYRLSDMCVAGAYYCYGDVQCVSFTADCKHVLVAMEDTRLLVFLVVDHKCEDHLDRLEGVLSRPKTEEELDVKYLMLECAGTWGGKFYISYDDPDTLQTTNANVERIPLQNMNVIAFGPGDSEEYRKTLYAQAVIDGIWRRF